MPESIRDENTGVTLHVNNDGSINVNTDALTYDDSLETPQGAQFIIDDTTTANITYFCYSPPGTATSAAAWRIYVLDESAGYPVKLYADGDTNYDNIADNRASLSYS